MWLLALVTSAAFAAPCATPFTTGDLRELGDRADEALDNDDMVGHAQVFSEIRERVHCLQDQVSAPDWARLLVSYSLVEYALDRNWRAPLTWAMTAHPDVDHSIGPDDIRKYPDPVHDRTYWVPVADDATFYLDGKPIDRVPAGDLEGPHVVQSYADGLWDTRFVQDEPYPTNWLRPSTASSESTVRKSPAPLLAGLGLVGAGTATGTATWLAYRNQLQVTEGQESTAKVLNVAGWAVAGVGGGLVAVHFLGGNKVSAGPLGLRGQF